MRDATRNFLPGGEFLRAQQFRKVVENDDELLSSLRPATGHAIAERSIVFEIEAWDRNCPQHIPQLIAIEDVEAAILPLQERIATLESELARARTG